ncbi:hypothetical protein BDF22DRAFT_740468 [Syncephalis plumigaleata]|nr:hypothetical protein BDF22DRAFT_740468 [Syncephalis plumigaleata]
MTATSTGSFGRILLIGAIALSSAALVYRLLATIPGSRLPSTLDEVKEQASILRQLQHDEPGHVMAAFIAIYLFKQTFAIPAGAIFGRTGFLFVCPLTAVGASFCYLLSATIGGPLLERYMTRQLEKMRIAVQSRHSDLVYYLICLRLFPFTPNWLVNIASPHVGVPLYQFFFSMLIGSMPYNFVSSQSGMILREISSVSDVLKPSTLIMLSLISLAALLPAIFRKRAQAWMENSATNTKAE